MRAAWPWGPSCWCNRRMALRSQSSQLQAQLTERLETRCIYSEKKHDPHQVEEGAGAGPQTTVLGDPEQGEGEKSASPS